MVTAGADGTIRTYTLPIENLIALAKSRLTCSLTEEECRKFLHIDSFQYIKKTGNANTMGMKENSAKESYCEHVKFSTTFIHSLYGIGKDGTKVKLT